MNSQGNNIGVSNMMLNNSNFLGAEFNVSGSNLQPIRADIMENSVSQVNGINNNNIPTIVTGGNNVSSNGIGVIPLNKNQDTIQNDNAGSLDKIGGNSRLLDDTPFTNETFNDNSNIIFVKDYLKYLLLIFLLPIGVIVYLIKAFSKNENKNINNLSKALLLFSFILVVVLIFVYFVLKMYF